MLEINATADINQVGDTISILDTTGSDDIANSTKYSTGSTNLNRSKSNTMTDFIFTLPDGTEKTITRNIAITDSDVSGITPPLSATSPLPIPNNALLADIVRTMVDATQTNQIFPVGIYKVVYRVWYLIPCAGNSGNFQISSNIGITDSSNSAALSSIRQGFADATLIKIISTADTTNQQTNIVDTITDDYNIVLNKPLSNLDIGQNVFIFAGYEKTLHIKVQTDLLACFQPKIAKSTITEKKCCNSCKSSLTDTLIEILFGIFAVDAQFQNGDYDTANTNLQALLKICNAEDCKTCS